MERGKYTLPIPAQKIFMELLADARGGDLLDVCGGKNLYCLVTFRTLNYNPRDVDDDEGFVDSKGDFDRLKLEDLEKYEHYSRFTEFRWNPYALLQLAMVNKLFYAGLMSDSAWARFSVYNVENVAQHFIAPRTSRQPDTALYDELYELRAERFTCNAGAIGCGMCGDDSPVGCPPA